jgi:hypothetical protein
MRGFESHGAAGGFCREHGELRNLLRPRGCHNEIVSAPLGRSVSQRPLGSSSTSGGPHELTWSVG